MCKPFSGSSKNTRKGREVENLKGLMGPRDYESISALSHLPSMILLGFLLHRPLFSICCPFASWFVSSAIPLYASSPQSFTHRTRKGHYASTKYTSPPISEEGNSSTPPPTPQTSKRRQKEVRHQNRPVNGLRT